MTILMTGRAFLNNDPKHRGPSPQVHRSRAIRELTTGQAPVALRAEIDGSPEYVRWSDGSFYRSIRINGRPVIPGSREMKQVDTMAGMFESEAAAISAVEKHLDSHRLIGGSLWIESSEPVVHVSPDGLYAEVISSCGRERDWRMDPWCIYPLAEAADALAAAASLLHHHYGTALNPPRTVSGLINVVMPEVFTGPSRAERIKAAQDEARAAAAKAFNEVMLDFTAPKMQEVSVLLAKTAKLFSGQPGMLPDVS